MGLVVFSPRPDSEPRTGYQFGETIIDLGSIPSVAPLESPNDALQRLDGFGKQAREIASRRDSMAAFEPSQVEYHTPVRPSKVVRLEGCYEHDLTDSGFDTHLENAGLNELSWPSLWVAPTSCLAAHNGVLRLPAWSDQVQPGVTLALVVGSRAKNLSEEASLEAIAGCTVALDVAIEDDMPGLEGYKMFDTALPLGPHVEPLSNVDLTAADLSLSLNGNLLEQRRTTEWRFSPGEMLAYATSVMTLEPGDVVTTGDPTRSDATLEAGDTLSASIDQVGQLSVTVEREAA